jgi:hypothetical protein
VAPAAAQTASGCGGPDSAAAASIRERLDRWVAETNRGDRAASTIWRQPVVGWFPSGREFSDSAAYAVAGVSPAVGPAKVTYEVRVDDVAVSGSLAAVHDIWREARTFPGTLARVTREIRGSELWRCEGATGWRIVRWVSAPEHWVRQ